MESKILVRWLVPALFGDVLLVGGNMGQAIGNLFQMIGGTETVGKVVTGASRLDGYQTKALGDNFGSAMNALTSNPLVKEGVGKVLAPKLGGILGALT